MSRPRSALATLTFLLLAAAPSTAAAFPWMVKHGYSSCTQCHADPAGAGVLTAYGRAQGEILLRTPWEKRGDEWEPGRAAQAFFGLVPLPPSVDMGYSGRAGQLIVEPEEGEGDERFLGMQNDLRAHVRLGKARVYASLAVQAADRTDPARITKNDEEEGFNLISREHWAGWDATDAVLVRGGRMVLPFGIRQQEHYLWVREATRTDIDSTAQHGLAVSYSGSSVRAELMGIAGNLQLAPDEYRERGYAGYAEYAIRPNYAVGVSSLATRAEMDLAFKVPVVRMAHGAFARLSPHEKVAILAEANVLRRQLEEEDPVDGYVSMLQVDFEPVQGLHLLATGESYRPDLEEDDWLGLWLSAVWYVAPHVDLRVDSIRRSIPIGDGDRTSIDTYLFQFHVYL